MTLVAQLCSTSGLAAVALGPLVLVPVWHYPGGEHWHLHERCAREDDPLAMSDRPDAPGSWPATAAELDVLVSSVDMGTPCSCVTVDWLLVSAVFDEHPLHQLMTADARLADVINTLPNADALTIAEVVRDSHQIAHVSLHARRAFAAATLAARGALVAHCATFNTVLPESNVDAAVDMWLDLVLGGQDAGPAALLAAGTMR